MIKDTDGQWMEDKKGIKQMIVHFFKSRWMVSLGRGSTFMSPQPHSIVTNQENRILLGSISREEVWNIVCSIMKDKAPRLDDFPLFFRHCWPIIQYKVVAAVREFFIIDMMLASLKQTLIALRSKW